MFAPVMLAEARHLHAHAVRLPQLNPTLPGALQVT